MKEVGREYDRDGTAILTDTYLNYMDPDVANPSGYESNPSQFRSRFHERVCRGMEDLNYLFDLLDADDLQDIFGPHHAGTAAWDMEDDDYMNVPTIEDGSAYIPGAIAFFAWALSHEHEPEIRLGSFIEAVELGLDQYLREKHNLRANVTVDVEVRDGELNETPD